MASRYKPEPKVLAFIADHALEVLYISTVTLAVLRFGIEVLSKGDIMNRGLTFAMALRLSPAIEARVPVLNPWDVT